MTITKYFKEFTGLFGLQASQEESDIFENNFKVQSVATVKGLKLVSSGTFPGVTLHKITSANESDIDTLSVSTNAKSVFHTAVQSGKTVYTPSAPVTYGVWHGLFYISIDFKGGTAGYIIGEGLNGGYTVEQFPSGWQNFLINAARTVTGLTAVIHSPFVYATFIKGVDTINWNASYTSPFYSWGESGQIPTTMFSPGTTTLWSGYGTGAKVEVLIKERKLGNSQPGFEDLFFKYGAANGIPPDLLKSMAFQESCCTYSDQFKQKVFDPKAYRYEAHKDYAWYSGPNLDAADRIKEHPERHFAIGGTTIHGVVEPGDQVPPKSEYLGWSFHMSGYEKTGLIIPHNDTPTAQQLYEYFQDPAWIKYRGANQDWNFTPQLLLASSYGILQALYETALNRMVAVELETKRLANDPNERPHDAKPITDLFNPEQSINIGAKYLKKKYDENGKDWWTALKLYNGASSYADAVIQKWNNGNGIFKVVIQ